MDEGVDGRVEVVDERVEVLVGEGHVEGADGHFGNIGKLPVDVVASGGDENHVDTDVFESDFLSLEWNDVEEAEIAVDVGVDVDARDVHVKFLCVVKLFENWHAQSNGVDVDGVKIQLVENG